MSAARTLVATLVAALAVFCAVQDAVTTAGAKRYVQLQRAAIAGRGPGVTVDEVMKPAIRRSVRDGLLSAAAVGAIGLGIVMRSKRQRS